MSVSRATVGIIISLLIFWFQISTASALDGKSSEHQKGGSKKTKVKRKAVLPSAANSRISAAERNRKPSASARTRPVTQAAKAVGKRIAARAGSKVSPAASPSPVRSRVRVVKKAAIVRGQRKLIHPRVQSAPRVAVVAPVFSAGELAGLNRTLDPLKLSSNAAFAFDESNSQVLFEKNSDVALPIASITKLMTGLLVVEARQNMDEILEVTDQDIDREKNTSSRLPVGAKLSRADMLHIALMSSENRAASALGRNYPGGLAAFVAAMNAKAKALGMTDTHYVEPTGLSSRNVASARDLAKLVIAAHGHPILAQYSTNNRHEVDAGRRTLQYVNSNRLVGNANWDIELQKTGYINEAGRCLVMQVKIDDRPVVMVFLDSKGTHSRFADADRVRKWVLEKLDAKSTTAQVKLGKEQS